MSQIWNASEYDLPRRQLIPCFDLFYTTAADLVVATVKPSPVLLDLGAGTGLLSEFVAQKTPPASLSLLDESPEMLAKAEARLAKYKPTLHIQKFADPLPAGPFDAVVSALAMHHLPDEDKQNLFARVYQALAPGGVFVNAEQVLGPSAWHEKLYADVHLNGARALGSSADEIRAAQERMSHDRCATLADQLRWLDEIGFEGRAHFFNGSVLRCTRAGSEVERLALRPERDRSGNSLDLSLSTETLHPSTHTKETLKATSFQGLFAIFAVFSTNLLPNP